MFCVLILIILEYIYMVTERHYQLRNHVLILIILEYIYMLPKLLILVMGWRLNSYYTGIHLHFEYGDLTVLAGACLNPYYTGIHLHINSLYLWNVQKYCLNPYYTGIHLHSFQATSRPEPKQ